jgi:hypothetical protein
MTPGFVGWQRGAPLKAESGKCPRLAKTIELNALFMRQLTFLDVNQARWAEIERLFESRGSPKSCWCMVWRARGEETKRIKGPDRRQAMDRRLREGVPIGLIGYLDGRPVAWWSGCATSNIPRSAAPRFRMKRKTRSGRSRVSSSRDRFGAKKIAGQDFTPRVATHRSACLLQGVVPIKSPAWANRRGASSALGLGGKKAR